MGVVNVIADLLLLVKVLAETLGSCLTDDKGSYAHQGCYNW